MPARTARDSAQASKQFLHAERLDEVVIRAGIDAIHLLAPAVARGQNDHRHGPPGIAPALQDRDAIENRQTEIEHHGIEGFAIAAEPAILAIP